MGTTLRRHRVRVVIWTMAAILLLAIIAGGVTIRRKVRDISQATASHLSRLLAERLGEATLVSDVHVGLRAARFDGVRIPLSGGGSFVEIPAVEVSFDALSVLSQPDHPERALRSVRVLSPTFFLKAAGQTGARDSLASWLPDLTLPKELVQIAQRYDSLRSVEVEDLRVEMLTAERRRLRAHSSGVTVSRTAPGVWRLDGVGEIAFEGVYHVALRGLFDAQRDTATFRLDLRVPSGSLPIPVDSSKVFTSGGSAEIVIQSSSHCATLTGQAYFNDLSWSSYGLNLGCDRVAVELHGDTLRFLPFEATAQGTRVTAEGRMVLKGFVPIEGMARVEVQDFSVLPWHLDGSPSVTGSALLSVSVAGLTSAPTLKIEANSPVLNLGSFAFSDVELQAVFASGCLEVQRLRAETCPGMLTGNGVVRLKPELSVSGTIVFDLHRPSYVMGWESDLGAVQVELSGIVDVLEANLVLLDRLNQSIVNGRVVKEPSAWIADLVPASGASSRIILSFATPETEITITHAEALLCALVKEWRSALEPLQRLDLCFNGSSESGSLEASASLTESSSLLSQLVREIEFSGKFAKHDSAEVEFTGAWFGASGRGDPFSGSAQLSLHNRVLTVHRLFVDDAGQIEGIVDLEHEKLDLKCDIRGLAVDKLPINPVLAMRLKLDGSIQGIVRCTGDLRRPNWSAAMSLTEATMLGVPNYWANLELSAAGGLVEVELFELGRDVNRIVELSGTVNMEGDQLSLSAIAGAARAEDFVAALTGELGLLSGSLSASATVSGRVTAPQVTASIRVQDGDLFRTLQLDFLESELSLQRDTTGKFAIRVPSLSFGKNGYYSFQCSGQAVPGEGGLLEARIAGAGNFLDLVDQVDRSFVAEGSDGEFELLLGGTLTHPILRSGDLRLQDGRFTYPDATPVPLKAEIDIHIAEPGMVERGILKLQGSPGVWMEVATLATCDSAASALRPLVIHTPHICLGALSVRTGAEGIPVRLPGMMKPEWSGSLASSETERAVTISSLDGDRLLIKGDVMVHNARMTFPLIPGSGAEMRPVAKWLVQQLVEARWDLSVMVGNASHYDVEVTGLKNSEMFAPLRRSAFFETLADYLDHISIDALIDPTDQPIRITGTIADSTFFLVGRMTSSRGRVEYLDQTFQVDYIVSDFDATNVMPILEGRAQTNGLDSLGRQMPVYLTMYQIDRETNTRQKRGRFDQVTFVLETDAGATPEEVLKLLGYDFTNAGGKAGELATTTVARVLGRQWLDPLERRIERWTPFDEVALVPGGGRASSLVRRQRESAVQDTLLPNYAVRFITGSQVTVGKYLTNNLFVTYTGELAQGQAGVQYRLGLVHLWNLEYRMKPLSKDLVLDLAVEYDEMERRRDESVSLKYSFPLEP